MEHQELSRLVEQAQAGSVEAFAMIYNEISKQLYYYALKITKNEHDAKDVVQETMIEVYKHLGELRNPGAFRAYVNSTVYRCSLNLLSKNKRHQNDDISDMPDLVDDEEEFLPEEYAESKERREYIIRLVDDLPDAQRTVVLLFYYKQLSSKEIADMLDIEDNAVRARLNRARATLRQKLEQDGNGKRKGAVTLLAIPVLTQVFNTDANMVFVQHIGQAIWESLGAQLGLSVASAASVASASLGSAGASAGAATAATTAATTAAGTAAVAGMAGLSIPFLAVAAISIVSTLSFSAGAAFSDTSSAEPSLSEPAPVTSIQESSRPEPDILDSIVLDPESEAPKNILDEASSSADTGQSAESPSGETKASEGRSSEARPVKAQSGAYIAVARETLSYAAGSVVGMDQILSDSGVTAFDDAGNPVDVTVLGYDAINFSVPDDYYVYFEILDGDGHNIWKAIIILIE